MMASVTGHMKERGVPSSEIGAVETYGARRRINMRIEKIGVKQQNKSVKITYLIIISNGINKRTDRNNFFV